MSSQLPLQPLADFRLELTSVYPGGRHADHVEVTSLAELDGLARAARRAADDWIVASRSRASTPPRSAKIALATGGRDFSPTAETFDDARRALEGVELLVGGDARGFDHYVAHLARRLEILVQPVPALWDLAKTLGRRVHTEGPIRNARMRRWADDLSRDYGLELVLIAGPGDRGTADMHKRCRDLSVREVRGRLAR